jgi:hypothetical protein
VCQSEIPVGNGQHRIKRSLILLAILLAGFPSVGIQARELRRYRRCSIPTDPAETPSDLAEVVAAWPTLPKPIQAGILAMVESSKKR